MIRACPACASSQSPAALFQNERYGAGQRVYNPRGGKNRGSFRCSVCEHEVQVAEKATPKKGG